MDRTRKMLTNPSSGGLPHGNATSSGVFRDQDTFELDQSAPYRAARAPGTLSSSSKGQTSLVDGDGIGPQDTGLTDELEHARGLSDDPSSRPIRETLGHMSPEAGDKPESWGNPFKIKWIKTEKLPFHRTRHLRNPWNSDREVKVSRDGTEVEPAVGQRLLDEWVRVVESPEPPAPAAGPPTSTSRNPPRSGTQHGAHGSAPAPSTGRGRAR